MKTDVSDLKGVEKIVNNLNWEKEKIKKLEEKNYWLQLENDAIKKR